MSSGEADNDTVVRELRDQIAANDLSVLEAVNRRVELVRLLKEHKDARGLDFVDEAQEERLLDRLAAANRGPLSEEAVRELYRTLLELTKKEL
ncbi:MAG TPA: chorismate mutase [Gaiellaceae bacterium]|jgi:chorismate mutase/prephenate dehydratase